MRQTILLPLFLMSILICIHALELRAETIQLTTYYPAPNGRYMNLTAMNLTAPGVVTGGGSETGPVTGFEMIDQMLDENNSPATRCEAWGNAVCERFTPSKDLTSDRNTYKRLQCPAGSTKRLTGLNSENAGIVYPDNHRPEFKRFIICISEHP